MEKRSKELLRRLCALPTGNIADAMSAEGLAVTNAAAGLRPLSETQRAVAGYAVTIRQMQCAADADGRGMAKHSQVIDELAGEDDLLVIDCGGRTDVSTGGSLLARRALRRGIVGYLVNGGLRDVREIAALGLPVYFKGATPLKSAPKLQTVCINEPVEIGDVQIRSGDIVVMDDTGVLVIPPECAEAVVVRAERSHEKEQLFEQLLEEGRTFAEARRLSSEQFPG